MSVKKTQKQTKAKAKAEPVAKPVETVAQAEPVESPPKMNFDDAVARGKELVARIESNKMMLGELADCVQKDYGDAKLAQFAEEIGFPYDTVKRYRSVFRKYKDKPNGATSPPFGVLSALAAVPERAEIINANPDMTTAEARTIASKHRATTKKAKPWKTRDEPGWIRDAVADALKARTKYGRATPEDFDPEVLRVVFPNPAQSVASLREGENTYRNVANLMEAALAKPDSAPPAATHHEPMFEDATPEAAE